MIAVLQELALDSVDLSLIKPYRRKDRPSGTVTVLPDDDVSAPEVLEVLGEGAERADDGVRVPAYLVLDALTFHGALP